MRPNLIFIMADDLGYADLGCYGGRVPVSPNIDRLASEGLIFTQGYSNSPGMFTDAVRADFRSVAVSAAWRRRGAADRHEGACAP